MTVRLDNVPGSARLLLRGAYPGLATALASALLVLLLWPQPARIFVAEAIVTASGLSDAVPGGVLAWLKSDEVLRAAAANLRSSQPREMAEFLAAVADGDAAEAIRQRIEIVPLASPDEMPRLAIGCQASRRREALAIADELARQLAEHQPAQSRRQRLLALEERQSQASAELAAAEGAEERLLVQLEGLRHAQLASAVAAVPAGPITAVKAPAEDRSASELARTLAALKLERDRLLEIYLPAHPQIQSLSAQISRLEESLRRTSPALELRGETHSATESSLGDQIVYEWRRDNHSRNVQASGQNSIPNSSDPRGELAAAIRQTQLDLLAATHQRQKAEHDCQALADERLKFDSAAELVWQVQPAQIASSSGSHSPRQQLAAALIAATIGGLGIGWLATRDQRLTTAADVRSSLALPVLGTLSSGESEGLAADIPSQAQAAVQLATRSAEVVLATFVLTLLAAMALDRGLLADLTSDPLATIGELVQRLI